MSVYSEEVAAVIESVNNMTNTVLNQTEEIQRQADEATKAVPETLRSLAEQVLYVDAVAGNDDNPGSRSNPFATVDKAIETCLPSMKAIIHVMEGQKHSMRVNRPRHWPKSSNIQIYLVAYGSSPETNKPTIVSNVVTGNSYADGQYTAAGFEGDKLNIVFINCIIETGALPTEDATAVAFGSGAMSSSNFGGFITRSLAAGGDLFGSLVLFKCLIKIQDFPLLSSQFGFLSVTAYSSKFERHGSYDYVVGGSFNRSLSLFGSTFSGFTDNSVDVLFGNGADNNLKTVV
ncbi:TPA: hypothetical protein NGT93_004375 [Vibrio parahaemolyticus]|nr:hypothetical protein [Vibrio parahaemolyticus]